MDPNSQPGTQNPIPNSPVAADTSWMSSQPGADFDLDALFPNPEVPLQAPPQAPAAPQPQAPAQAPEVFLKTATGTVYKTPEEAVRGTEEKDRVIAQLRAQVAASQGVDPLKKSNQEPPSDPRVAYFKELASAAEKGDAASYLDTLGRIQDARLAPYAPLLAEVARERAVRKLESEMPAARQFLQSSTYNETLDALPRLKEAITMSENDPNMADQLKELYKIAALSAQGMRTSELVRTAAANNPVQPVASRPTLTASTPTPTPVVTAQPDLTTSAGRKAIIAQFEANGGRDRIF